MFIIVYAINLLYTLYTFFMLCIVYSVCLTTTTGIYNCMWVQSLIN